MNRIDVITIFPEWFDSLREIGVTGRALAAGRVELTTWNPRDFTSDRHRTVDDRPYGGGPGMVMRPEPLAAAVEAARGDSGAMVSVLAATVSGMSKSEVERIWLPFMWWALALGAGFGANGTPIGSTANVIAVKLSERTRSPITTKLWMRTGLPVMIVVCAVATVLYILTFQFM